MKKREYIIIAALLAVAIVAAVFLKNYKTSGKNVVITVNDSHFGTFSLYEDRTVEIVSYEGTNVVCIQNGKVYMESADCPNQLCVNMLPLVEGDTDLIVCMPHGVIIKIN